MSKIGKSEKTKSKILESAKALFMEKGFNNVTVREIAKNAHVSHTTIYLYYKDKEELLNEIALQPLLDFQAIIQDTYHHFAKEPRRLIKEIGKKLIYFGISNRTMYDVYFNQGSVNVLTQDPSLKVNEIRNELFGFIIESFALLYPARNKEDITNYSRMFYFFTNGLITSYVNNTEETKDIIDRIQPLVEDMYEILLNGMDHYKGEGEDSL